MPNEPAPIVVEASGEFLGNDGAWSPFFIRVGNPPTKLQVLASTKVTESWVVLSSLCPSGSSNCTEVRGGTFDTSKSTTWVGIDTFGLGTENNLGFGTSNGVYGQDTLGVGFQGRGNVTLDQQVVAGLEKDDFFIGSLGLSNRSINFIDQTHSTPSFMFELKSRNYIPSLSYGYTAGASYHSTNASLTLGGFDATRFSPNDVSFSFSADPFNFLTVGLQSIVSTDSSSKTTPLLPEGILALVDSTVPHIWLPKNACDAFERAFGITYQDISNLYLVNDTLHSTLIKQNPSIVFQLGNSKSGGPSVNITLPYASFDLQVQAGYPLVQKTSRYFPLRQARDETQYTLGRTFLQEAFLTVNYEGKNFTISQSLFPKDSASHIVPIPPVQSQTTQPSSTNSVISTHPPITKSTSHSSHSLPTPAIAGIAIAIIVLTLVAGAFGVWVRIKRKRNPARESRPELAADPRDVPELEGKGNQSSTSSNDKKSADDSVAEVTDEKMQVQLEQNEIRIMDQGNNVHHGAPIELGGSDVLIPELPSPDPARAHELCSPEAEIMRSELSTPEPFWRPEMPSPEMGDALAGRASPPVENSPSPLSSPGSLWSTNRALPRRPTHGRMDSSESEGAWTRDGMPSTIPRQNSHPRVSSTGSDPPNPGWARDRIPSNASSRRQQHARVDSSDSEGAFSHATFTPGRPAHARVDSSDSEATSRNLPQRRPSTQHRRLDSSDSAETWETRLEMSPNSPYFPPPTRLGRDRHVEAVPSIWPDSSQEGLISSGATSTRSGLRSPEPLKRGLLAEEEEDDKDAR